MTPLLNTPLNGVYIGTPARLPDGRTSAIVKHAVTGPVAVTATGLVGDKVANRRVHGGPEMAVHHYPAEHYARWAALFPDIAEALLPGSIGENLSTTGLTEANVHIGDVYGIGTVRVQVNQPRMPCININARYQVEGLAEAIMPLGLCGWYCRVLQPGILSAGQAVSLLERPAGSISLQTFWQVQNAHRPGIDALEQVANAPALAEKWQKKFGQRVEWLRRNGG